jgi:hypothetical protein
MRRTRSRTSKLLFLQDFERAVLGRPFFYARAKWYFGRVKHLFVCILLLLAACHERRPPGPTAEQNQQLNDAEDMLNAMAQNEEGPEDRSPGPSNSSD